MTKAILVLVVCGMGGIAVIGCEKPPICIGGKDENGGIIVSEFDFGDCFNQYSVPANEWVITNDSLYQLLKTALEKYPKDGCDTTHLPPIDFSKYTLLGKRTEGGCRLYNKRKVIDDKVNKQYIYEIKVKQCGICKRLVTNMNWVLVPKLPPGYSVKFIIK